MVKSFGRKRTEFSRHHDRNNEEVVCRLRGWVGKSYENEETEIVLFKHTKQKLAVFGFRGTEPINLEDWKKNFQMNLAKASIGSTSFKIHQGFRDRYMTIASWFEAEYQNIQADYTIMITGHSLGGALATIAAQQVVNLTDVLMLSSRSLHLKLVIKIFTITILKLLVVIVPSE